MFQVNLYIEGSRADLFGDETLQVTDSIKNLMSPDLFFSAYSQQFSLPATAINNNIFSHYHNPDVIDGFLGFQRHDAEIRINGLPWRKGQIKLNSVKIEHGRPSSYDIVFYGNASRLKEQLRNSNLRGLTYLERYDHAYNGTNVKNGFEIGLDRSASFAQAANAAAADIVYPFISHTGQYILDDTISGNIYRLDPDDPTDTTTQLEFTDLKPAIRLSEIIVAIETEFGITFDKTGFLGNTQFGNLWMWCHGAKGGVVSEDDNTAYFSFNDRVFNDGGGANEDVTFGNDYFTIVGTGGSRYEFDFDVTTTGTGAYDIFILDVNANNAIRYESLNNTGAPGTISHSFTIYPNTGSNYFRPYVYIISEGTITNIDLQVTASFINALGVTRTGVYDWTAVSPVDEVSIPRNMPDMSCLDFLTGMMKMFNLVIYADNEGTYYLETMNDYYASGSTRDITRYVDDSQRTVKPPTPYDDIIFKFEEGETFLISERRDRVGESYGDETYSLGSIFEDNDFEIEIPFEKILFERMTDISDDSLETNMWAWCADQDGDPILTAPIIFHYDGAIPSDILPIQWEFDGSLTQSVTGGGVNYARCSNTVNDGTDWTLTFGSELGEYTLQPQSRDLFTVFWEDYITGVYDSKARRVELKAWLPSSFVLQYNLADTIIYRNRAYFINSMDIDVRTGETTLELITKWL